MAFLRAILAKYSPCLDLPALDLEVDGAGVDPGGLRHAHLPVLEGELLFSIDRSRPDAFIYIHLLISRSNCGVYRRLQDCGILVEMMMMMMMMILVERWRRRGLHHFCTQGLTPAEMKLHSR